MGMDISRGALEKFGGYSKVNALQFSQEQAAAHGWSGYGDPEYVPHVMRYYSGGGWFTGLFGNRQLVNIAKGQLGNEGGEEVLVVVWIYQPGGMVCLLCQLVCESGRFDSKWCGSQVFPLYGW